MKVTIITVVLNREKTIEDTIVSVLGQTYKEIEYIVIDGKSSDDTMAVVHRYSEHISQIVCAKDGGIYDALNKGIALATGDVIGFLHSDDFYIDKHVIADVVNCMQKTGKELLFADLLYIDNDNKDKILRHYSAKNFTVDKLRYGLMPPHPTLFVNKSLYEKVGLYSTEYRIAGDFDMFIRLLLKHKASFVYLGRPLVKMRVGGASTGGLRQKINNNLEQLKSLRQNELKANHFTLLRKYPHKVKEVILGFFWRTPKK